MEECFSTCPGDREQNHGFRLAFTHGMKAAQSITITCELVQQLGGPLRCSLLESQHVGHVSKRAVLNFVTSIFPITSQDIVDNITSIMARYPKDAGREPYSYMMTDPSCLAEVQSFVLGFYYAMLKLLLDTSQLIAQEAYGDGQWNDLDLFDEIKRILQVNVDEVGKESSSEPRIFLPLRSIIQLLAIFFTGADRTQRDAISASKAVIGLHGKIFIVPAGLLRHADEPTKAMKFYLLVLDYTAIQSDPKGLIFSADDQMFPDSVTIPTEGMLGVITEVNPHRLDQDFTSHIEPDWDNDLQVCRAYINTNALCANSHRTKSS